MRLLAATRCPTPSSPWPSARNWNWTRAQIARGLASCPARKCACAFAAGGVRVLDDAYNANADSMLAALQTLRDLPARADVRVAAFGDMAELGRTSGPAHAELAAAPPNWDVTDPFAVLAAGESNRRRLGMPVAPRSAEILDVERAALGGAGLCRGPATPCW